MTALEFLSVAAAADHGDIHPVARSSMERRQRDVGAVFEERDGWLLPVSIPGEDERLAAVGIADLSHLAKFEVRPSGDPVDLEGVLTHRLSPRRALVLCEPRQVGLVQQRLTGRLVLDLTGALAVLGVAGPKAETVMRRLTHLHHFPSSGEVAHVNAHVLLQRDAFLVVVPQESGHYLWEVAVDRAEALGGGPVGLDAFTRGARS
jgi:glycine cleavage system aminomethyltransferase T